MSVPWDVIARVAAVILIEIILLGGLIAIPIGLAGNFIILATAIVVGVVTKFTTIPLIGLIIMAVAVIAGEIIEAFLGSVMARRYGASKWGMLGAFVGGIVGAILGTPFVPVMGTIVGSFLGAGVGAVAFEWFHLRQLESSMPAGIGALIGKIAASLLKLWIGIGMVVYIQICLLPRLFR